MTATNISRGRRVKRYSPSESAILGECVDAFEGLVISAAKIASLSLLHCAPYPVHLHEITSSCAQSVCGDG